MSACRIDESGAGKYKQQFATGARRFCEAYSGESWSIGGVETANGLALNVSFNEAPIDCGWPLVLVPTLTLDEDVFAALTNLRGGRAR